MGLPLCEVGMLQRLYDATKGNKKRKVRVAKLEALFREAMPYYDSDYDLGWNMTRLVNRVLEICDGKK